MRLGFDGFIAACGESPAYKSPDSLIFVLGATIVLIMVRGTTNCVTHTAG